MRKIPCPPPETERDYKVTTALGVGVAWALLMAAALFTMIVLK